MEAIHSISIEFLIVLALKRCDINALTAKARKWGTHGKQLGEHHHRRNRPCTYPNWHRVSYHEHVEIVLRLLSQFC